MRIACPACQGAMPVRQVSPDYDPAQHRAFVDHAVQVAWFYQGERVDLYLLSPQFAREEKVILGDQALPDDYPTWVKKVRFECERCFNTRSAL